MMKSAAAITLLVFVFCWTSVSALGSEIPVATSTTMACFAASPCSPASPDAAYAPDPTNLYFNGISFGGANGATTSGGLLTVNLGTFTLNDQATFDPTGLFVGEVTFTLPQVISESASNTFTANVSGVVKKNKSGSEVDILFGSTPQTFYFSNAQYAGQFDFAVNDVILLIDQNGNRTVTADWTGQVSNASQIALVETAPATTPEPASMLLFVTGIGAVCSRLRRRSAQVAVVKKEEMAHR